MSSSRINYVKQQFPIISQSWDAANNKLLLATDQLHYLYDGAEIKLFSEEGADIFNSTVTLIGNTSFSIEKTRTPYRYIFYHVYGYLPEQANTKPAEAFQRGMATTPAIIQSYVTGNGGASFDIEVSLDSQHWINVESVSHDTNTGNTQFVTVGAGWTYYRANSVSVGANTTLTLITGN